MNLFTFAALQAVKDGSWVTTAVIVVLSIFGLVFLFVLLKYANLYVQSVLAKAEVGLFDMFAMSLRKVPPKMIVDARIMLVQSRIEGVAVRDLEAHYLAGGHVMRVVHRRATACRGWMCCTSATTKTSRSESSTVMPPIPSSFTGRAP